MYVYRFHPQQYRYLRKDIFGQELRAVDMSHGLSTATAPCLKPHEHMESVFSFLLASGCLVLLAGLLQTFHADCWTDKINNKEGSAAAGVADAGHWPMLDQPDVVNRRLDAFFAEG